MISKQIFVAMRLLLLMGVCVNTMTAMDLSPNTSQAQPKVSAPAEISPEELKAKIEKKEKVVIIDVRSYDSYVGGPNKIKGALHYRLRRLRDRLAFAPLKDLSKDTEIVTYCACADDEASVRAAEIFTAAGFKRVRVLAGGWQAWLSIKGPVDARPRG